MTDKEKITAILKAYTKKHNIMASSVILEEYAEELIANGVIVPPCKVGDTIYFLARSLHTQIDKVKSGKVVRISITENGIDLFVNTHTAKLLYGKRAFLTKEEAEEKLKELGK